MKGSDKYSPYLSHVHFFKKKNREFKFIFPRTRLRWGSQIYVTRRTLSLALFLARTGFVVSSSEQNRKSQTQIGEGENNAIATKLRIMQAFSGQFRVKRGSLDGELVCSLLVVFDPCLFKLVVDISFTSLRSRNYQLLLLSVYSIKKNSSSRSRNR